MNTWTLKGVARTMNPDSVATGLRANGINPNSGVHVNAALEKVSTCALSSCASCKRWVRVLSTSESSCQRLLSTL